MGSREQAKAARRWRRNRRIRDLKSASSKTFRGCTGGNICYGVPFPPGADEELTEEDLAHFERILADYLP